MNEALFDLTGRTALVTGSSRGIGKAVALTLGRAGAKVVFHASKPSAKLDETVQQAKDEGIAYEVVTADLAVEAETAAMLSRMTMPDIVVFNASRQNYMPIEEFDDEEFDKEYTVNVKSFFILMKQLLPVMRANHFGRVITIGSVNQWKQSPRLPLYASTKSALVNIVMSVARSYAQDGITVNNVAPGIINTDRNAEAFANPELVEKMLSGIPVRRFGEPEDIAGAVLLLASPAGAYINGADIPVTGGMHL